jgi:hypothetical protein
MKREARSSTGRSAEIAENEIDDLKHGSWFIDCARLELKQRGPKGIIYFGPGCLRQDAEKQLVYKIYATCPDDLETLWHNDLGVAGSVVPEHAFYDLTASDSKGREWHSERILPGATNWGDSKELVVEGRVDSLICRGEIPEEIRANGCSLSYDVFDSVKIPTNARTSEHRHVAGWSRSHRYDLDSWRFRAAGLRFLLSNSRTVHLQIHVATDSRDFPLYLEERVLEALFFVLGHPLYPTITHQRIGQQTRCTLSSHRSHLFGVRHKPPLNIIHLSHPKTGKHTTEPYRKLFHKYLVYTLPYKKRQHPLWGQLNAAYEASAGTFINSQALTLAVAIESILGSEFPGLGKPSTTECKKIDTAIKYWDAWNGGADLKKRIEGSIRQLKQSRAGDKMRVLAKRGAITAEAAKAWHKLRNANVHAYQRPSGHLRQLLGIVQTLFYQLVFYAIGYHGHYHDYGTLGWPLRQYPPGKEERATGEEIEHPE